MQEAKLRESEDHYRAILNSTSDVYFLVNPELKLLATNSIGEESLARLVKTWNLPDRQTAFENLFKKQIGFSEYFQRALAGEVVEAEREVTRYDGSKVWYYHRYLPVLNSAKESIGVSISMTNIHTRKMQALEIEAKNQALINIAWSQSHEMRRPVASILGLIQLRKARGAMITEDEFIEHLSIMIHELDEFIKKNVERTYLASQ
jgi:PAS domain-containing protein